MEDLKKQLDELNQYIQNQRIYHRKYARDHYRRKHGVTPDKYAVNRIRDAGYFWKSKTCREVFPTVDYF